MTHAAFGGPSDLKAAFQASAHASSITRDHKRWKRMSGRLGMPACRRCFSAITFGTNRSAPVDKGAERLVPKVMALKQRLQAGIPSRPDILFHLLWSRVIDDAWADAWKAAFKSDGPPNAAWVIDPHQPFDVGTNYGSVSGYGSYALTWSDA